MKATALENKYLDRITRSRSLLLIPATDAIELLEDCASADVRFLGVEAFRLFDDGGVQPAMTYSNISFGKLEEKDGKLELASFRRELRSGWRNDPEVLAHTRELIREGEANGYTWYEVSIEDPDTGELLFFRRFE